MNAPATISLREYTPKSKIILRAVSEEFDVSESLLLSEHRHKFISEARHVLYYALKSLTRFSYPYIGNLLNRDHSTVVHGVHKVEYLLARDDNLRAKVESVIDRVNYPERYDRLAPVVVNLPARRLKQVPEPEPVSEELDDMDALSSAVAGYIAGRAGV